MGLMDPVTRKIRLNNAQCVTCPGNPRTGVKLRPGRLRDLIRANTGDGKMGLVCHATIDYSEGGEPEYGGDQALCKWFYDSFGHLVNGIRVMSRLGGFTGVDPPAPKEELPAPREELPVSKLLSIRESAVLRIIGDCQDRLYPATGAYLARTMVNGYDLDTTPEGAHKTAASLVRKNLAYRVAGSKNRSYKLYQAGLDVIKGDQARKWRVR
jgi:hypothetical protein